MQKPIPHLLCACRLPSRLVHVATPIIYTNTTWRVVQIARVCVDENDFTVDSNGILHVSDNIGKQQLLPFPTPGSYTFNVADHPGLKAVRVICIGAGGGGAGAFATPGQCVVRAGGSGGGYSESVFAVADLPTGNIAVVVGAEGAGGAGNSAGSDGGASSFGGNLVMANGGKGSAAAQTPGTGAGGVTGTGGPLAGIGQIRMGGGPGHGAIRLDSNSGLSGAGGFGGGGWGQGGGARASEGDPYGERGFGGGGGGAFSNATLEVGGTGSGGLVAIYLQF